MHSTFRTPRQLVGAVWAPTVPTGGRAMEAHSIDESMMLPPSETTVTMWVGATDRSCNKQLNKSPTHYPHVTPHMIIRAACVFFIVSIAGIRVLVLLLPSRICR
jgi:hypothetical protein